MAIRDRVAEIAAIKSRGPKAAPGFNREFEILHSEWQVSKPGAGTDDFFPIRAVTLLEVFTRAWVAHLIDHGVPYAERAVELKIDIKFDLGMVRAIHGRVVTLGDVLAHNISLNSFGQICDVFSALVGQKIVTLISKAVDTRVTLADLARSGGLAPRSVKPIVTDADLMCKRLAKLFELRHILCHEFPRKELYQRDEITAFLTAASEFTLAINEVLTLELHSGEPTSMAGKIEAARRELEESEQLLAEVVARVDGAARDDRQRRLLVTANKRWLAFREAQSAYCGDIARGGTASEWLKLFAAERLTWAWIAELRNELSEDED